MAYPIYTTLLVVSRSGIPIALAKLISEKISRGERKAAFQIFKVSRYLSFSRPLFLLIDDCIGQTLNGYLQMGT